MNKRPVSQFDVQGSALNEQTTAEPIIHQTYSLKGGDHDTFTRAVRVEYQGGAASNMRTEAVFSLTAAMNLRDQLEGAIASHEREILAQENEPLAVACAWCGKHISGPERSTIAEYDSHGICPDCVRRELRLTGRWPKPTPEVSKTHLTD